MSWGSLVYFTWLVNATKCFHCSFAKQAFFESPSHPCIKDFWRSMGNFIDIDIQKFSIRSFNLNYFKFNENTPYVENWLFHKSERALFDSDSLHPVCTMRILFAGTASCSFSLCLGLILSLIRSATRGESAMSLRRATAWRKTIISQGFTKCLPNGRHNRRQAGKRRQQGTGINETVKEMEAEKNARVGKKRRERINIQRRTVGNVKKKKCHIPAGNRPFLLLG